MILINHAAFEPKLVVLAEFLPIKDSWSVKLECGHETTFKTHPGERSFCRECAAAAVSKGMRAFPRCPDCRGTGYLEFNPDPNACKYCGCSLGRDLAALQTTKTVTAPRLTA